MGRLAMVLSWRSSRLAPRRRSVLLCVLAALVVAFVGQFGNLVFSYRLAAAQRALRRGDAAEAIALLEQQADRGARSPEWHYLLARAQRRSSHYADAEKQLAEAGELGWNERDIRRERLLIMARRGQVKQVEAQLAELLAAGESDEAAEDIYEAMAQSYWAAFYVEDALKGLQFWSDWQPENLRPQLWIADLYERVENANEAIAQYRRIIERDPKNAVALAKLGGVLLKKLELAEAAQAYARCLTVAPENADALLGLADCRRRQGANDEAKDVSYEALTLDLTSLQAGRATSLLGTIALEDRDYARAVRLLQESIALNPNDAGTHVSLAAALTAIGQEELAAKERQVARDTSDRHARLLLTTNKVIEEPANADLRCEAGVILMDQGFWSEGADWIKTAIQIDPKHHASHEGLARYYEHLGNLELAKKHRTAAEQAAPPHDDSSREEG